MQKERQIWTSLIDDLGSTLVCLDGGQLYVDRTGDKKKRDPIIRRLKQGEDPSRVATPLSVNFPTSQLQAIEVPRGSASITFCYREAGQKKRESLPVGSEYEAGQIASEIASALGVAFDRRQRKLTSWQMTGAPIRLAVFLSIILSVLYYAAATIDPASPGPLRAGRAGAIKNITLALGTNGIMWLAAGLAVLVLAWCWYRVTHPTKISVYSFQH